MHFLIRENIIKLEIGTNILKKKNKKWHKRGYLSKTRAIRPYFGSIHDIPTENRNKQGTWQIDTMYIKNGFIFVAVEVISKKIFARLVPDLKSKDDDKNNTIPIFKSRKY